MSLPRTRRASVIIGGVLVLLAAAVVAAVIWLRPDQDADQLDAIQRSGELNVAVFDSNPPFGSIDPQSRRIVGYDVDFAQALADSLGVKLKLVPTNPANRIPLLQSRAVDLIVADITITPERAQVVDFSIPYFVSGQQVLVPASRSGALEDYARSRIAAVKGTTGEQNIRALLPRARVIAYDDLPAALTALRSGQVDALTQDSALLAGLLSTTPDAADFKILANTLSREEIGIGVRKGETRLLNHVDTTLRDLESRGQVQVIFDRWFGAHSSARQTRSFKIS